MRKSERRKFGNKANLGAIRKFASFASSISSVHMGIMNREAVERLIPDGNYRHIRVS